MTIRQVSYGAEKINVKFTHIERAIDAACSSLTKELAFNDKVKDNPAQVKEYNLHISVLRLLEQVFADGFKDYEKRQRNHIPRGKRV
jgi:hypothetical protein